MVDRWFRDGIAEKDLRTTHVCVKNDQNQYIPKWVSDDETIRYQYHVVNFIAGILERKSNREANNENDEEIEEHVDMDGIDDFVGPSFQSFDDLADLNDEQEDVFVEKVNRIVTQYERYNKGYVANVGNGKRKHFELSQKYRKDHCCFWNDPTHSPFFASELQEIALYVHSIKPASANCETEFSKMAKMTTSYTAKNEGLRLTIRSQLPAKRKLQNLMSERRVKKAKLFHRA